MTTTQRPPVLPREERRSLRVLAPFAVAAAGLAAVATVGVVDPNEAGHYPTCPFLALTGLYCPGCGSLRALHALAHLDVATAAARNPLLLAALPLLGFLWLAWARRAVTGRGRTWAGPASWVWGLLAVVLAFWVLRNVPGWTLLAP